VSVVVLRLGHALGGPTYLVRRANDECVLRVAFTNDELDADEHELDEHVGWFFADGRMLADGSATARRLAYDVRAWRYDGERSGDDVPVWRLRESAASNVGK